MRASRSASLGAAGHSASSLWPPSASARASQHLVRRRSVDRGAGRPCGRSQAIEHDPPFHGHPHPRRPHLEGPPERREAVLRVATAAEAATEAATEAAERPATGPARERVLHDASGGHRPAPDLAFADAQHRLPGAPLEERDEQRRRRVHGRERVEVVVAVRCDRQRQRCAEEVGGQQLVVEEHVLDEGAVLDHLGDRAHAHDVEPVAATQVAATPLERRELRDGAGGDARRRFGEMVADDRVGQGRVEVDEGSVGGAQEHPPVVGQERRRVGIGSSAHQRQQRVGRVRRAALELGPPRGRCGRQPIELGGHRRAVDAQLRLGARAQGGDVDGRGGGGRRPAHRRRQPRGDVGRQGGVREGALVSGRGEQRPQQQRAVEGVAAPVEQRAGRPLERAAVRDEAEPVAHPREQRLGLRADLRNHGGRVERGARQVGGGRLEPGEERLGALRRGDRERRHHPPHQYDREGRTTTGHRASSRPGFAPAPLLRCSSNADRARRGSRRRAG